MGGHGDFLPSVWLLMQIFSENLELSIVQFQPFLPKSVHSCLYMYVEAKTQEGMDKVVPHMHMHTYQNKYRCADNHTDNHTPTVNSIAILVSSQ